MSEAVIVDVDGTLVDVSSVRHHVVPGMPGYSGRKRFDLFHDAAINCPPIPATVEWVAEHRAAGRTIIVVTARDTSWSLPTLLWLAENGIEHDHLFMRPAHDRRPDVEVKARILRLIRASGYRVVAAIDDNPKILDLWRSEGIAVTEVPGWIRDGVVA